MSANIKFAKTKYDAIVPSKREEDAGFDLYACFEDDWIEIKPHSSKLIPTGIATAFDKEYCMLYRERGSTGSKNIKINAGVIDSGYRGEHFVSLYNGNDVSVYITKIVDGEMAPENPNAILYPYWKAIAQAILVPVPNVEVQEIPYEDLVNIKSERGIGALGSSQK